MKNKKMRRLFLLTPAIALVLFLLNSFIPKGERAADKKTKTVKLYTNAARTARAGNKDLLINSILKTTDGGEHWNDVSKTPPAIEQSALERFMVKTEGVWIGTNKTGVMRSTDNGKHWQKVINEGGSGMAVSRIEEGFTAIVYNATTKSNEIRISLDKGETWQSINNGLPTSISSIKQMGKYLICGHMGGLYQSANMGKTWKRVLCAIPVHKEFEFLEASIFTRNQREFVLRLYVSGNALYAVSEPAGC
ncbi:WD40/YVTN/BNR-like repeat-containing protein [Mucilaginibacter calamicampi]|uniref:WD40/YVTN/BNR-like repeat-containing protein n=1 Tax=Mucilaginibacter calamicampi TaxID=1302352 RepID=A0ABW2YVN5_9SPHI